MTEIQLNHAVGLSATWDSILAFADDPRCDNMMAAGFSLAMLAPQEGEALTRTALGEFLNAMPERAMLLYFDAMEASVEDEHFCFDSLFSHIIRLSAAREAAIVISAFYANLIGDGRAEDAEVLSYEVRRRVRMHLRRI